MENKTYLKQWITNLIEDPTPQARGQLRKDDSKGNIAFCCLGDLCETLIELGYPEMYRSGFDYEYKGFATDLLLPLGLTRSLEIVDRGTQDILITGGVTIADLNDEGVRKELLGIILYLTLLTDEPLPEDLELFVKTFKTVEPPDLSQVDPLYIKYRDKVLKEMKDGE